MNMEIDGKLILPADRKSKTGEKHLYQFQKEDYLKVIGIYNILKEGMLDMIVDFFEKPNNFKFKETITMKDILTSNNFDNMLFDFFKLPKDLRFLKAHHISKIISQYGTIHISGTRTEKTMQLLSNYIEQNIVRNDNIVEVNDIGKQVISEMLNPTIEDETEKQEQD